MNTEKQRAFIIHFVYSCLILALLYLFLRYVMYTIMPFLIGFLIAFMLRPLIKRLTALSGGHEKLWSSIVILVFYATIGAFVTLLFMKGFAFLKDFVEDIPRLYQQNLEPFLNDTLGNVESVWKEVDITGAQAIQSFLDGLQASLYSIISSLSKHLVSLFTGFASSLPNLLIAFFFAIISSFFFNADYPRIIAFFIRQLPFRRREHRSSLTSRHYFTDTIARLAVAYGKNHAAYLFELTIGLHILGIENALVIAFLIAIFDVLPVLGTGGIMLPWILISFLNNQVKTGVGLLILYLVITVIRNIIEPKIVGKQIGLHPLLMLMCMYLGARLFGFLGIFILPILILIVQNLNDTGIIHIYNS